MTTNFENLKIYYSGSIKGGAESDINLPKKIVDYMKENGATVLSEHVACSSREEMNELFAKNTNTTIEELKSDLEPWIRTRRTDLEWVKQATHMVALINTPSHGVGMEIQRAIDKPKMGMNKTPILCLVRPDSLDSVSYMIRGITDEESNDFKIATYNDFSDIEKHIFDFLSTRS